MKAMSLFNPANDTRWLNCVWLHHAPMFKHHPSLKHALLSKLPNIHRTPPVSVTVSGLKPHVVYYPKTGALIQWIMGMGISSSSNPFGSPNDPCRLRVQTRTGRRQPRDEHPQFGSHSSAASVMLTSLEHLCKLYLVVPWREWK